MRTGSQRSWDPQSARADVPSCPHPRHSAIDITSPGQPLQDAIAEPQVLVICLGMLADVLKASPVAAALHEAHPAVHQTWLVHPFTVPFVRANPYVDEVITDGRAAEWLRMWRTGKLRPLTAEVRAFVAALRERRFDIAIDLTDTTLSAAIARASGAPRRIGAVPATRLRRWLVNEPNFRPPHPTRFTQSSLALLASLGIASTPRRPILAIPEAERLAATEFLRAHGVAPEPYAACCISPAAGSQDWLWSRWSELADELWTREGMRTVFLGGSDRRVDALALVENCASRPVSAIGHTSLLQSAAIVQDAALVIGCDTGLSYAGLATDTPTVVLFGPTDPCLLAEEPHTAVCFRPLPCSPCTNPQCERFDCLRAVTVADVADTACNLLTETRPLVLA